jgi:hypothetical protein
MLEKLRDVIGPALGGQRAGREKIAIQSVGLWVGRRAKKWFERPSPADCVPKSAQDARSSRRSSAFPRPIFEGFDRRYGSNADPDWWLQREP